MDIPAFVSEQFVIAIETSEGRRKLFQVLFRRTDGSLFVAFPYYKDVPGILSLGTLRAKAAYPSNLSLADGGKVTGHKVKYSHHPEGQAHFSQDGKIRSSVRKRAVSLLEADGHLFTVHVQGLGDFKEIRTSESGIIRGEKKTILNFRFEGTPPAAIKFLGHWHRRSALLPRISGSIEKPWVHLQRPDGSFLHGVVIRNAFLDLKGDDAYLLLTCEAIALHDKDRYSTLTFVGGFDRREIALDHNQDTTFLALAYPITADYGDLVKRIGSVDHIPTRSPRSPDAVR